MAYTSNPGSGGSSFDSTGTNPDIPIVALIDETTRMSMPVGGTTTPKKATISVANSGNNTVVAGVTNKIVRVLAYMWQCNSKTAGYMRWRSANTDKTGNQALLEGVGVGLGPNKYGWIDTAVGEDLNIYLPVSGSQLGGHLTYVEVNSGY